jgi:hypothetical protein
LHEGVGEKKTDSLRLLIVIGGHGTFVAAFRNSRFITDALAARLDR